MILDEIAKATRSRVAARKDLVPLAQVVAQARAAAGAKSIAETFCFERALEDFRERGEIAFICELKKASPSKGVISRDFPYLEIALEYQAAGAAAISVLTEPDYFQGCDRYLAEIAAAVAIPVLRKDFTVDPYQIYEAACLGASAVLLICALLDLDELREYIAIADSLGLSALVEAHNEEEVADALAAGARVIGVNNRDLRTFAVDLSNSRRLRALVPDGILFVSESGIRNAADVDMLRSIGTAAVLIGESLMTSENKRQRLAALRGPAGGSVSQEDSAG